MVQRLNIAVDVADALDYLHNCEPPVVHCDLKPSNILPLIQYGEGSQVSPSGDVYSFGSVILELFTGMEPTHDMFRDGLTLQKHAENAFPDKLMEIVDPVLPSIEEKYGSSLQNQSNRMEDICNTIFSIIEVALSCCKQAPTERMCTRDAAAGMRKIRDSHVRKSTR
ncbi:probable LRR receptor-like serine/threonine-protein kinase At3g47570 [Triticum aestivum]|uniref:probable LRR receptor-like serine/threonine-protein kinase At3g47570 n=1 Tax=Triticum aestivum TaxID=4565 RepID=UPI001D02EC4A|nr:probable LRR receptor-like serine/threonine-protein kinase At3g47570 [Triticum aestivum]